jgi:putative endonuclease
MPTVWTYVVQFEGGHCYVGLSKDLGRRLEEHARRQSPSTRRFAGTPRLIYQKEFSSYVEARSHEKFLKSGAGRRLLESVRT